MIKNMFHAADIDRLKTTIDEGSVFVLTCHAGPDGDALGSTLGLAHYLQALGKEAVVIVPDAYPDFLAWMPGTQEIIRFDKHRDKAELMLAMADSIFAMDYNALSRVDDMGPIIERPQPRQLLRPCILLPPTHIDLRGGVPSRVCHAGI